MQARKLALIVLGFLATAFFAPVTDSAPQSDQQEENLTFPDDDQAAPGENLTFPDEDLANAENLSDSFQDTPPARIALEPIDIPGTDMSLAPAETEPNEKPETASKLGSILSAAGEPQYAARGSLNGRDDDYFSFSTEGKPRLYLIEAVGPGVDRVGLYELAGRLAFGNAREDGTGQSITGVYLAPGDYHVSVEHFRDDGETPYAIRAVSLGVPDPSREREPNGVAALANPIEVGVPRTGLLPEPKDVDYYYFSLAAEQLVRLRIEPPPEARLTFALTDGPRQLISGRNDEAGAPIEYVALLPAGDYLLNLQARKGTSNTPYVVSLTTGNRFEPLVDLEPNDEPHEARPVPANGRIRGLAKNFGDFDWYELPEITGPTAITIHSGSGSAGLWLNRMAEGKPKQVALEWSRETNTFSGNVPGSERYLLKVGVRGEYDYRIGLNPVPAGAGSADGGPKLSGIRLEAPKELPPFAAFWDESQAINVPLDIRNENSQSAHLALEAATSHPAWRVTGLDEWIEVGPGQSVSVPVTLEVAPDSPSDVPVRVDFRIRDANGGSQIASFSSTAVCGADPINPGPIWTLPEELVGGFNVAWGGLGGSVVDAPDGSRDANEPYLYDGITPNDDSWYRVGADYPLDLTVQLAGEALVPVAGIILNPQGEHSAGSQVRYFELHLSPDGIEYSKAISGELTRARIPQHFVLPRSVEARFARLRILSSFNPRENRLGLGEFAMIADPAANPFAGRRLNLAEPALGGYVVWSNPRFSLYSKAEGMLTEEADQPYLQVDPVLPTEWVIGFNHDRAARITELQWVDSPGDPKWRRFHSVQVSVSTDGPTGPWETLGTWNLDRSAGAPQPLILDQPAWARFVRFVSADAETAGRWEAPETLRILELGADDEYRSILAEWGQYSGAAVYEWMQQAAGAMEHAGQNSRRDGALQMNAGTHYEDQVERGQREAWYRFEVPADHNLLRVTLTGRPVATVVATLEDDAGTLVPLEESSERGNELVLESLLNGGGTYWLRLVEPVRHVVVSWDNSGSVRPYRPVIYSALTDFIRDLRPGDEFVRLLPFSIGGFLLDEWSDQAEPLMAALQSYPRKDDDSNAETYLLVASNTLGVEKGAKAVILVTDAETFSYGETPALWHSLSSTRPRVFAVELHSGGKVAHQQDLMQSWADVNHGFYAPFRQRNDLDIAFDRAFCHIRRPVRFAVMADSRFEEPPGPGFLAVDAGDAISANAVELILDASGSMLQRLDGTRRIEIARTVLTDLINNTIPEGTPLAMRVFGHRKPDACDTDLAVRLQPLDRGKVTSIIQSTQAMNLARTPIGESLRLVGDDLKSADGQKLIILITDGEETCDGDPAGAIASLKESGHDVRVNIVGFAIDDVALQAQFEEWSRIGGGLYFNATSAAELDEALRQALRPKYQVLDETGAIVANGTTGAGEIELPSGAYTVKILTSPIQIFDDVRIEPEDTTRISANSKRE